MKLTTKLEPGVTYPIVNRVKAAEDLCHLVPIINLHSPFAFGEVVAFATSKQAAEDICNYINNYGEEK